MKKFYKTAGVHKARNGFEIHLDGRAVKTPLKDALLAPNEKLAKLLAAEWQGQGDTITPEALPLTRLANTAQDLTAKNQASVVGELMAFAGHDLVCYRAEGPPDLRAAEDQAWDPYLEWLENAYGLRLGVATGIDTLEQEAKGLEALRETLLAMEAFPLTALHNATTLTGSLVLALALIKGFGGPDKAWAAAHVDEDYQAKKWGQDDEAQNVRARRRDLFDAVVAFMAALR